MTNFNDDKGKKIKLTKICLAYDPTYKNKKVLRFCIVNSFKTKVIFVKNLKKIYNINDISFAPCKTLSKHNYYYEVLDLLKPNETKMSMNKLKYCDKKFEGFQLGENKSIKIDELMKI